MGIINVIKNIKLIHAEDVVLVHIGKFYYMYGKDAYILSYLFGYKLMLIKDSNIYSCAFPTTSFAKVIAQIENKKMNYIIVDRRNNYDIEEKANFGNLNTYQKNWNKAKKYVNLKLRIERINQYLLQHLEEKEIEEKIGEMEKILNETRKI